MYPATESGQTKVDHLLLTIIFITVFIRRAPVEDNTELECICAVAQRMVVKFYNYTNTVRTCTDTMRTANDTPRIPVPVA